MSNNRGDKFFLCAAHKTTARARSTVRQCHVLSRSTSPTHRSCCARICASNKRIVNRSTTMGLDLVAVSSLQTTTKLFEKTAANSPSKLTRPFANQTMLQRCEGHKCLVLCCLGLIGRCSCLLESLTHSVSQNSPKSWTRLLLYCINPFFSQRPLHFDQTNHLKNAHARRK